jgi:hypothetical protein
VISGPTATPTPLPSLTPDASITPTLALPDIPPKIDLDPNGFLIHMHPENALYVGDLVSFEIISPPGVDLSNQQLSARLPDGGLIGPEGFDEFGIGDRLQATLRWEWDTVGYDAGEYPITFTISPNETVFTHTVTLLPESLLQFPEPDAGWQTTESDCCIFYYVSGTASARDADVLAEQADLSAARALEQIEVELVEPIEVVWLPRVLGHGGFATDEIYISYLDRNYAGNGAAQVIHHEIIHILDARAGADFRPTMFVEGLAVYLSDGHFKVEPILPRAVALLELGWYIPLAELTEDFYLAQHEISYLQSAALVQYMIERWGYEAFDLFYRSIATNWEENRSAAYWIDLSVQANFGITFDELESDFIAYLAAQPFDPLMAADVRLSVTFFDTLRRYQQALDPSAYFLTAWLVQLDDLLEEPRVLADYLRHPDEPINLALETMLVTADQSLRAGDYERAGEMLGAVNAVLAAYEAGEPDIFYADPIAVDYYALVLASLEAGYTPEIVSVNEGEAVVTGTRGSNELVELNWVREESGWELE